MNRIDQRNIIALEKKINKMYNPLKLNVKRLSNSNYVIKVSEEYKKQFEYIVGKQFNQINCYNLPSHSL